MNIGSRLIKAIREKGKAMESEMSFFEHLEALRWHLIRAALVIVLITIFAFIYYNWIFANVIFAPTKSDFWTYRMMCGTGDFLQRLLPALFKAKDFCVQTMNVHLINTEM